MLGLAHHDVSLENTMLDSNGDAITIDFGMVVKVIQTLPFFHSVVVISWFLSFRLRSMLRELVRRVVVVAAVVGSSFRSAALCVCVVSSSLSWRFAVWSRWGSFSVRSVHVHRRAYGAPPSCRESAPSVRLCALTRSGNGRRSAHHNIHLIRCDV